MGYLSHSILYNSLYINNILRTHYKALEARSADGGISRQPELRNGMKQWRQGVRGSEKFPRYEIKDHKKEMRVSHLLFVVPGGLEPTTHGL